MVPIWDATEREVLRLAAISRFVGREIGEEKFASSWRAAALRRLKLTRS
jgi:hypothetical protein